jgi:hypothetical protein
MANDKTSCSFDDFVKNVRKNSAKFAKNMREISQNISNNFNNNNIRNDNRSEDNVYKNIEEYKKLCGFSEQSYYGQSMSQKIQVISKKI